MPPARRVGGCVPDLARIHQLVCLAVAQGWPLAGSALPMITQRDVRAVLCPCWWRVRALPGADPPPTGGCRAGLCRAQSPRQPPAGPPAADPPTVRPARRLLRALGPHLGPRHANIDEESIV